MKNCGQNHYGKFSVIMETSWILENSESAMINAKI